MRTQINKVYDISNNNIHKCTIETIIINNPIHTYDAR